jgi:hypothetical protein
VNASNPFHAFSGYELRHLPAHLVEARKDDVLDQLLKLEFRSAALVRNAWFDAKEESDDVTGYLSDVAALRALARVGAEEEFAHAQESPSIGREVRGALLAASVRSLAANVPPRVLASLVAAGIWRPDQALSYVEQQPPKVIPTALEALAPLLPSTLLDGALEIALRQLDDAESRLQAIRGLAPHLPAAAATKALRVTSGTPAGVGITSQKAYAVAALTPRLPRDRLVEAARSAGRLNEPSARALALVAVAAEEGEPQRSKLVARVAALLPRLSYGSDDVLAQLVRLVTPASFDSVLSAMRAIATPWQSARALRALGSAELPMPLRETAARAAEEVFPAADDADWTIGVVSHVVAYRPHEIRERLDEVLGAGLPEAYARRRVEMALSAAPAYSYAPTVALMLAALAGYFRGDDRARIAAEAVSRARSLGDRAERAKTLAALVDLLPDKRGLCEEALRAARASDGGERAAAFSALVPHLPASLLPEALDVMTGHFVDYGRVAAALRRLPAEALDQAIAFVRAAPGQAPSTLLPALLPRLPEAACAELLREQFRNGYVPGVMRELAASLPDELRLLLIELVEGIDDQAAGMGDWEAAQSGDWEELCQALPVGLLRRALQSMRRLGDVQERVTTLSVILAGLQLEERQEEFDRALASARSVRNVAVRARAIAELVSLPANAGIEKALGEVVDALGDDEQATVEFLTATAASLSASQVESALSLALRVSTPAFRIEALIAVAPRLPAAQLNDILRRERSALPPQFFALLLAGALERVGGSPEPDLLHAAVDACTAEELRAEQAPALTILLPLLAPRKRAAALRAVLRRAKRATPADCSGVLSAVATRLEGRQQRAALDIAYSIRDLGFRANALIALAPQLSARERGKAVRDLLDIVSNSTWDRRFPGVAEAAILAATVPLLSEPELVDRAVAIARGLPDGAPRAEALSALARQGTDRVRGLAGEALRSARQAAHPRERLDAALELLQVVDESQRYEVIERCLHDAVAAAAEFGGLESPPAQLVTHMRALTHDQAWELWRSTSRTVGAETRQATLRQVAVLGEVVCRAGGTAALAETARAVNDVGGWWP